MYIHNTLTCLKKHHHHQENFSSDRIEKVIYLSTCVHCAESGIGRKYHHHPVLLCTTHAKN